MGITLGIIIVAVIAFVGITLFVGDYQDKRKRGLDAWSIIREWIATLVFIIIVIWFINLMLSNGSNGGWTPGDTFPF